jgi:integrase
VGAGPWCGDGGHRLEFKDTKTEDSVRVVSLRASALTALDTQRKRQEHFRQQYGSDYRADLDLIFGNPDGTPLKPDSISSSVSLLCRRLKLPKGVSLHTLRHSHGSHLLAAGMEITAVSERGSLITSGGLECGILVLRMHQQSLCGRCHRDQLSTGWFRAENWR